MDCTLQNLYQTGIQKPYTVAFSELKTAASGLDADGRELTLIERTAHAAKGALLLIPVINVVVLAIFERLSCLSMGCDGALPTATTALGGGQAMMQVGDLRVSVTTAKADDGEYYAKIDLIPPERWDEQQEVRTLDFVFCVDTSGSMLGRRGPGRLDQVKDVLNAFLDRAAQILSDNDDVTIGMSLVGFNHEGYVAQEAVELTQDSIEAMRGAVNSLRARGSTDIVSGLQRAAEQMGELQRLHAVANRALVFLTDGDDHSATRERLSAPQANLAQQGASLFALGISTDHDMNTMQRVIQYPNARYSWIDTENQPADLLPGQATLSQSMQSIFEQAAAQWISDVRMQPQGLVDRVSMPNVERVEGSFNLGAIPYGVTTSKVVRLLDGDPLEFRLQYTVNGVTHSGTIRVPLSEEDNDEVMIEVIKQEVAETLGHISDIPDARQQMALIDQLVARTEEYQDEGLEELRGQLQRMRVTLERGEMRASAYAGLSVRSTMSSAPLSVDSAAYLTSTGGLGS